MKFFGRKAKKQPQNYCSVIVLAAGSSNRMGQDKIMMDIAGVPTIVHTLRVFEAVAEVNEVIVVTREDLVPEIAGLCKMFALKKVKKVVRGGSTRAESARLGTLEIAGDAELVAIHDGARPFVSETVVREVILKAAQTGAAAPAVPVTDTIKVAHNGLIESTPDRNTLFAVQTPQVFDSSLICAALQKSLDDGVVLTDDCAAVERLGMKVSLTAGDECNFKLTTPADIMRAEAMLKEVWK